MIWVKHINHNLGGSIIIDEPLENPTDEIQDLGKEGLHYLLQEKYMK